MIRRSLTSRLLIALLAAQVSAIMLAMLVFPLVAPFVNYDDIAEDTFRARIEASLVRTPSGDLAVVPDAALDRYVAARRGAAFAVMSLPDGAILPGSDTKLGEALARLRPFAPRPEGNLITGDAAAGQTLIVTTEDTRFGLLVFATVGNAFHAEDWASLPEAFLPVILPIYAPAVLGALVLVPLTVTMVTRPLRRLAAEASRIEPGALAMRLGEDGLGAELQSLARAINAALARIEQGVARQRLYAANAAHELRTPIAILSLRADRLPNSDAKAQLQADIGRLQTLVEQLVTVARLGQTHVPMDETVDLVQMLRDVVADRAPIAFRVGKDIELETEPHAYLVRGNAQALFSAVANVIVVHGEGIAPADRAVAFQPFWRGRTTSPGGGLGLAIVKEIADRHRVSVAISESAGGGVTFRFDFGQASSSPSMAVDLIA